MTESSACWVEITLQFFFFGVFFFACVRVRVCGGHGNSSLCVLKVVATELLVLNFFLKICLFPFYMYQYFAIIYVCVCARARTMSLWWPQRLEESIG